MGCNRMIFGSENTAGHNNRSLALKATSVAGCEWELVVKSSSHSCFLQNIKTHDIFFLYPPIPACVAQVISGVFARSNPGRKRNRDQKIA
jgi:hypothetical protein